MSDIIRPKNYRLEITPDLQQFRFSGRVTMDMEADLSTDRVVLNLLELAVWRCRLKIGEGWQDCAFSIEPNREELIVILTEARTGHFQLQIDYQGQINDKMAGFYRSGYEKGNQTHYIAVTQFQESSARQAFPCMDHPLYKATFDLVMNVPENLQVIANTPMAREQELSPGIKQVIFERSPTMSTYLVFFAVGAFEFFQDDVDPRVRVATLPGLENTTSLGLSFGRKALKYCEDYYGIDYPLAKMDLIAVPDFAFGAMENWGAITFRENLLLFFPETTSAEGVERICEVIAHEIAHQWFGNLVTPADWKFLWLNESFATYFGFGVVAHNHPDWGTWDQFLHTQTATAMARDGLRATFPIEIPGGEHVVINSSTAPIIYNKGASMLRMIEGYIGEDCYKQGVRTYLGSHAYGCARSHHLWEAFEDAASVPITAMVQNWIGQPGYPLITARRQGDTLNLEQQRFTYLPHPTEQTWIVPVTLQCWTVSGDRRELSILMEDTHLRVDLPDDVIAYKLNTDQTGFYRVHYDDDSLNLAALGGRIKDRSLAHTDRWGLQNDLFALVRAGHLPLDTYIDFIGHYVDEDQYLPLVSITGHLQQAFGVVPDQDRSRIAKIGGTMAESVLTSIGMAPEEGEPHTRSALRNQLLWQAAGWGAESVITFAVDQFEQMAAGHNVHPDIARSIMQVGARVKGAAALDWFKTRFVQSPSEHERMNILAGMGAFGQWDLIQEALAFALDAVPPRNRFVPIVAAAGNTFAVPYLWDWYKNHLQNLETFHPLLYERVITGIVPMGGLDREEEVKAFFETYLTQRPQLKDAVELALENLAINSHMRARG